MKTALGRVIALFSVGCGSSMGQRKSHVTPGHKHWSYVSLALTHRFGFPPLPSHLQLLHNLRLLYQKRAVVSTHVAVSNNLRYGSAVFLTGSCTKDPSVINSLRDATALMLGFSL